MQLGLFFAVSQTFSASDHLQPALKNYSVIDDIQFKIEKKFWSKKDSEGIYKHVLLYFFLPFFEFPHLKLFYFFSPQCYLTTIDKKKVLP